MLGGILYLSLAAVYGLLFTMLPPFGKEIYDNPFGYAVNH
jgi:hypothetical protein